MKETAEKKSRKGMIVGLAIAGVGMLGISVASAVALGIEANNELGAGTSVTATCQPVGNDIVVGFEEPTYVAATQSFDVDQVNLTNIAAACDGLSVKVVVADGTGAVLAEESGTVSGASYSTSFSPAVDSEEVAAVSVVIWQQ